MVTWEKRRRAEMVGGGGFGEKSEEVEKTRRSLRFSMRCDRSALLPVLGRPLTTHMLCSWGFEGVLSLATMAWMSLSGGVWGIWGFMSSTCPAGL